MSRSFYIRMIEPSNLKAFSRRSDNGVTVWGPTRLGGGRDRFLYFNVELQYETPSQLITSIVVPFLNRIGVRQVELFNETVAVEIARFNAVLHKQSRAA